MINSNSQSFVGKRLLILAFIFIAFIMSGCSEKTGALEDPLIYSYITPTIQNLAADETTISLTEGGILRLTCEWTTPRPVSSATAYLAFVRTIQTPKSEPVGIIASEVVSVEKSMRASMLWQTVATSTAVASDSTAFYLRFQDPIAIPCKIATEELSGAWAAEIPFSREDLASAPLGIQQMIFYMSINGMKTNTLSFEITFNS
ncbi:MAG: hypothetical protein EOM80_02075 [Erysipelotrichia bacterium]|nr:hypothetical protein [Candidatus Riflebacteria bacterium]NCB37532.1 hypothetical protein [Erysipelotrichia bacterium]